MEKDAVMRFRCRYKRSAMLPLIISVRAYLAPSLLSLLQSSISVMATVRVDARHFAAGKDPKESRLLVFRADAPVRND